MENENQNLNTEKNNTNVWTRIGIAKYFSAGLSAFLVIAMSILFAFCLLNIRSIIRIIASILSASAPLIYGLAFAYILKPIYNRLERWLENQFLKDKKLREHPEKADSLAKAISSIAVVFLLVFVIVAIIAILIPELYNSVITLTENLPTYIGNAREWLHSGLQRYPDLDESVMSYFDNVTNLTKDFFEGIFPELDSIFSMVTSGIGSMMSMLYNILIGLVVAIYMLNEKDTLTAQLRKIGYAVVKADHVGWYRGELRYADKVFSGFVFARFVDSIALGIVYAIIGSLLRIPYVGMISVVIAVTNMIPFFGMYIGLIPCALILLLVDPFMALVFVIVDIVIMQIDANIISPKIIGGSTGLSGFWVLFALLFFGGIWGFFGMLVGVPVFAVIYHQVQTIVDRRLHKKEMSTELNDYIRDPVIKERQSRLKKMMSKMEGKIGDKNKKADSDNKQ